MRQPLFPITLKDNQDCNLSSIKKGGSFDIADESTKHKEYSSTTTQVAISEQTKEDELSLSFEEDFFLEIQRRGGIDLDG
jgi:hypothetical protein